jgi:hypothetical protein
MLNRFTITSLSAAIISTAILVSPLNAQMRGAGSGTVGVGIAVRPAPGATPGFAGTGVAGTPGRLHHQHSSGRPSLLLPYPYFYSDYATDNNQEGPAPPPQVVIVPAAAPVQPAQPPPPLDPLLIEWQGDHFVRTTLSQKISSSGQRVLDDSAKPRLYSSATGSHATGSSSTRKAAPPPHELPPAVLVFRDGRQEEVNSYTIISGIIYSKADYWTGGSWTRKIQIADLDVPATLKLNQEHGLNFVLPASPNEVVVRP